MIAAPKPPAHPATDRLKANTDDNNAYSVAEWRLLTMAIKNAKNAAVPMPPVKDSVALAAYMRIWCCSGIVAFASAIGNTVAAQAYPKFDTAWKSPNTHKAR